jgi:hypothetical protein
MREYIAKPPDPCTEKAMMPQINLIKLTFINAARESAYQCRQGERGTCGSRKFEFRKNTKYAAGTSLRHSPVGAQIEEFKMKHTMIAVAAGAMTLAAAGSAFAQAIVVEGPYAAPVYEVAPAPYYAAPVVVAPAPRVYAAPPAVYDERVIRRGHVAREVIVTEPQPILEPAPGVIYSNW